jgi:hypothetical protein
MLKSCDSFNKLKFNELNRNVRELQTSQFKLKKIVHNELELTFKLMRIEVNSTHFQIHQIMYT